MTCTHWHFDFDTMKSSARPVNNTSGAHIELRLCLQSCSYPKSSTHLCNNHQISQSSSQPSNNLASQSSVITPSEHSDSQPTSHSPGIQQLKQSANQANYLASTYDFVLSCLILSCRVSWQCNGQAGKLAHTWWEITP